MTGDEGIVPLHRARRDAGEPPAGCGAGGPDAFVWPPAAPIRDCTARRRACVCGVVRKLTSEASPGVLLVVLVEDDTGTLRLVFLGRREVPGIVEGAVVQAEGMVGSFRGALSVVNPRYRFPTACR